MTARSCIDCEHWSFFGGITGSYGDSGECAHLECWEGGYEGKPGVNPEPRDAEEFRRWVKMAKTCQSYSKLKEE